MSRKPMALLDRLSDKFVVGDGCWEWTAYVHPNGYGRAHVWEDGKNVQRAAHRVVYELMVGPVPAGLELDHLCRNRRCVRPDHLEPVTRSENILRGLLPQVRKRQSAERTLCRNGHPFTLENTYPHASGMGRSCLTCQRLRQERYDRKRRAS